ncbi:MAG TPA: DUF2059 domain-containing protein [Candidatus Acidoferrales bacterium]
MKRKTILALAAIFFAVPVMAQAPAAGRSPSTTPPATTPPAQTGTATQSQAQTQGSASTSAVDPAKAALVQQLMQLTGGGKEGEQYIDYMTGQVHQAMSKVVPQPDRLQQFMDEFGKNLATRVTPDQVENAAVAIYAQHLSVDDLQAIIAFYKTPQGQDVLKALPLINQESQNTGANMVQPAVIDTLNQMTSAYPEVEKILPRRASPQQNAPGQAPAQTPNSQQPSLRQIPSSQ